mmetsp:Transcript_541/g.1158  ORF Transcript_541/g.1158 Transcript_541/m.1158 type:complete len:84 (-) Transcript_541:94-345(-)
MAVGRNPVIEGDIDCIESRACAADGALGLTSEVTRELCCDPYRLRGSVGNKEGVAFGSCASILEANDCINPLGPKKLASEFCI